MIDFLLTGSLKYSKVAVIWLISLVDSIFCFFRRADCRNSCMPLSILSFDKAILGSLCVILKNATKYSLSEVMLSSDLHQLGLPAPYQLAICRPFSNHKLDLMSALSSKRFMVYTERSFMMYRFQMTYHLIGIFKQ